jgi:hypothetical protein
MAICIGDAFMLGARESNASSVPRFLTACKQTIPKPIDFPVGRIDP